MTQPEPAPRRRRRRAHREAGPAPVIQQPAGQQGSAEPDANHAQQGSGRRRTKQAEPGRPQGRDNDRGWRELAGNSPSQVGVSGALRARDVARPGAAELAAAERDLQIVRRQWLPPDGGLPS